MPGNFFEGVLRRLISSEPGFSLAFSILTVSVRASAVVFFYTISAVIISFMMRLFQRVRNEGSQMTVTNNAIDLTVDTLVIEIMDFLLLFISAVPVAKKGISRSSCHISSH